MERTESNQPSIVDKLGRGMEAAVILDTECNELTVDRMDRVCALDGEVKDTHGTKGDKVRTSTESIDNSRMRRHVLGP